MSIYEVVAKGHTLEDGTYVFTCGHCGGNGRYGTDDCSWCYGLDTAKILEAMRQGARGQRYYGLLKSFLSVHGKAMVGTAARLLAVNEGKLTMVEIAYVHLKFGLNFKATCEWLEETHCVRAGTYELIIDNHWKVRDIVASALKRYPELQP